MSKGWKFFGPISTAEPPFPSRNLRQLARLGLRNFGSTNELTRLTAGARGRAPIGQSQFKSGKFKTR